MSAPTPPAAPAPAVAEAALVRYFSAERAESVVFVGCAAAAAAASAALVALRSPFRAMAWPLLAAGLVQLVVGGVIFLRTPGQRARLLQQLRSNPAGYRSDETARMVRVQRSFVLYKRIEDFLLTACTRWVNHQAIQLWCQSRKQSFHLALENLNVAHCA